MSVSDSKEPGFIVNNTTAALLPDQTPIIGRFVTLRPLTHADREALCQSIGVHETYWDMIPRGPYPTLESFDSLMTEFLELADTGKHLFYAITPTTTTTTTTTIPTSTDMNTGNSNQNSNSKAKESTIFGIIGLWSSDPLNRTTEFGPVVFGPSLQRSHASTEVLFLLLSHTFNNLRYRRVEWKTDSHNIGSRRAAERYGFSYEGCLRQHMITTKNGIGRNRDTVVYSILDREWEGEIERAYVGWLDDGNFDDEGKQKMRLGEIRKNTLSHES